jgi:hypothetical protein
MAHGAKANLAHGRRQAAAMQPSWATAVVIFKKYKRPQMEKLQT